jgi:hypothetical protein
MQAIQESVEDLFVGDRVRLTIYANKYILPFDVREGVLDGGEHGYPGDLGMKGWRVRNGRNGKADWWLAAPVELLRPAHGNKIAP